MPRASDLRIGLGLDWGNASPGCVVWGAALPDGHVTLFDEFKFQRMSAKDVALAVKAKCREWGLARVPLCACDPSLLPAKDGEAGEWIGQVLIRHGLPVYRVSNDRVNGWQRVHEALAVDPATGTPWLTVHPRCKYVARTVPLMIQAKMNPEDMDSDGDDHACLAGGTLVSTDRGDVPIADVRLSDRVRTPAGWREVFAVAMTDADAEVWTVTTTDGRALRGTANHPVMVDGRQVRMDTLRYGDILTTWPIPSHGVTAMRERNGGSIGGRFRRAFTFTTGIGIRAITPSTIWNACRRWIMPQSIPHGEALRLDSSTWRRFGPLPWRGIAAQQADNGTDRMGSAHGAPDNLFDALVSPAGPSFSTSHAGARHDFAATTASRSGVDRRVWTWSTGYARSVLLSSASVATPPSEPVLGLAVVACSPQRSGRGKVFNLTVDGGVFFANGILTHNCDALRYLLMGGLRPATGRTTRAAEVPNSMAWWRRMYGGTQPQGVLA